LPLAACQKRCNVGKIRKTLVDTYRQDFTKYAKKFQIKYVSLLFGQVPLRVGKKFKYSDVEGDFRKRELAPAIELLSTAGIIQKVISTAGQGLPLGSQADQQNFKVLFLDVALTQTVLGLHLGSWITSPFEQFVNKGELVEAFVGQELLAYAQPFQKAHLYYWHKDTRNSQAEVDYLIQKEEAIVPIKVKSGTGTTLKSMQIFLESHPGSPYGIRFSTQNYSQYQKIHSYPLYAVAKGIEATLLIE
jgi:predicted AAA+ superfamily ATPase